MTSRKIALGAASALFLSASGAMADGLVRTGPGKGTSELAFEVVNLLNGPLGYSILIISVVVSVFAFISGRMMLTGAALASAMVIGFGAEILVSFSGVSATLPVDQVAAIDELSGA